MALPEDLQKPVDDHHWELHKAITQAHEFDFRLAYELDRRLKASPALVEQFAQDPKGVAKQEVGLELPDDFHIHFITEQNEYVPRSADPKADPIAQLHAGQDGNPWGRVEIRTAIGPGAIAISSGIPSIPDPPGTLPPPLPASKLP